MNAVDIRNCFKNKGIKVMVFEKIPSNKQSIAWSTPHNLESIGISLWKSIKHGTYRIITLENTLINNREIKCINKGTVTIQDRNVIFNVLKNCLTNKQMSTIEISNKLKEKFEKKRSNIVLKNCESFSEFSSFSNECAPWCSFKINAFGKYTILLTKNIISID